jgi:iron complex transport system substrate-binding protein
MNVEELSAIVVDAAFNLHKELGPGLLESVYEAVLCRMLEQRGLRAERQHAIAFDFYGMHFDDGLRVDILVNDILVIELKSVETLAPVHTKQLLTYLRLLKLPLGLLINFGAATFKEGCKRIVNNHKDFVSSRLRVNASEEEPMPDRTRSERQGNRKSRGDKP